MAYPNNPDDPYRVNPRDEEFRRAQQLDNDLQPDPELVEGSVSGARMALYAAAIALVLGVVFYGLNHSSTEQAGTTPPSQTAQTQPGAPTVPPGMRDVTPRPNDNANTGSGVTTGSSTTKPAQPMGTAPSPAPAPADNGASPPAGTNTPR